MSDMGEIWDLRGIDAGHGWLHVAVHPPFFHPVDGILHGFRTIL
jgi:hypothetical protein